MDAKPPTYDELTDLTRRQARQIDELRAEVERLKAELEQSRRAGKRQAAPFSKGAPKANPKRPGRKAGHPPSHRPAPPPEQVDLTIEVPLPPECPECRAPLEEAPVTVHDQYQIDLPQPKPVITLFRVLHDGVRAADGLVLPARRGDFFNPNAFPFLEGRPRGSSRQIREVLDIPRISDGVVFRVLNQLLHLATINYPLNFCYLYVIFNNLGCISVRNITTKRQSTQQTFSLSLVTFSINLR